VEELAHDADRLHLGMTTTAPLLQQFSDSLVQVSREVEDMLFHEPAVLRKVREVGRRIQQIADRD